MIKDTGGHQDRGDTMTNDKGHRGHQDRGDTMTMIKDTWGHQDRGDTRIEGTPGQRGHHD